MSQGEIVNTERNKMEEHYRITAIRVLRDYAERETSYDALSAAQSLICSGNREAWKAGVAALQPLAHLCPFRPAQYLIDLADWPENTDKPPSDAT